MANKRPLFCIFFYFLSRVCFAGGEEEALLQLMGRIYQERSSQQGNLSDKVITKGIENNNKEFDRIIDSLKKSSKKSGSVQERVGLTKTLAEAYYLKARVLQDASGGNPKFRKLIKETFKKSSELNYREAKTQLGLIYRNQAIQRHKVDASKAKALAALGEAVQMGDPQAMGLLAKDYETGFLQGKIDCQEALSHYEQAASQGDAYSQYRMGELIVKGEGCGESDEPELEKARDYFKKFLANNAKENLSNLEQTAQDRIRQLEGLIQFKNRSSRSSNEKFYTPQEYKTPQERACPRLPDSHVEAKNLSANSIQIANQLLPENRNPAVSQPVYNGPAIAACCKSVQTGQIPADTMEGNPPVVVHPYIAKPFDPALDPYSTGPRDQAEVGVSWGFGYTDPKHFRFNKAGLATLGGPNQIQQNIPYQIPPKKPGETDEQYYPRRLSEELANRIPVGKTVHDIATKAGAGSQSQVYWLHGPVPADSELLKQYPNHSTPEERRKVWASVHSTEVVKLRNPSPWNKDEETAAKQARRDIALESIFETFASRYAIVTQDKQTKPLVEVVKYRNEQGEIGRGVFRQEAVQGESAYNIAWRIKHAMSGDQTQESYLINQLKFKDLEDAKLHINALENFYRQTHNDVYNFQDENNIGGAGGFAYHGKTVKIGFDYNLGVNVMWDPKKKIFRAFDY